MKQIIHINKVIESVKSNNNNVNTQANIIFEDGTLLSYEYHQDSLQNSSWDGEMSSLYAHILNKLGYHFTLNSVSYHPDQLDNDTTEIKGNLVVIPDPEYPEYPYETNVNFTINGKHINFSYMPYSVNPIPSLGELETIYEKVVSEFAKVNIKLNFVTQINNDSVAYDESEFID